METLPNGAAKAIGRNPGSSQYLSWLIFVLKLWSGTAMQAGRFCPSGWKHPPPPRKIARPRET